jgi:hypothetical protein
MDGLPLYFFTLVGIATCGLGAFVVLALFTNVMHRYLRLEMIHYSKELSDAEKEAGIKHEPKVPAGSPKGPGV